MSTSVSNLISLDPSVRQRLDRVAGRLRTLVLIEGVAWVVLFLFAAAIMQFVLDYSTRGLQWSMRAALLGGIVVAALWIIRRRVFGPLGVRFGAADVAHLVERRYPQLSSSLVSAVQFSSAPVGAAPHNSAELTASVVHGAAANAAGLDFDLVLNPQRMRRAGLVMMLVVGAVLLVSWVDSERTYLWFARNVLLQDVPWPRRTTLMVESENKTLIGAKGDDLVIMAHALGVQPREVEIVFETAGGQRGRQTMVTVGGKGAYRYRYTFEKATEDFSFYLVGGDDRTEEYQAKLLERPRVVQTEMHIVPPEYCKQPSLVLKDAQRAVDVLRGTEVTFRMATNHPVVQATLMVGDKPVAPATRDGDGYSVSLSPKETHTYSFKLVDEAGLENREQVRLSVQVVKDEPPHVRLKLPGVGEMVTPEAMLPLEMSFEDEFGLATAEILHQVSRENFEEQSQVPPSFRPGMTTLTSSLSWPVASVGAVPGERLTLYIRATDFDNVSGPNSARSQDYGLRVVTRDELLAELARREREYRADFERLVDAQEQLRSRLLTLLGRFSDQEPISKLREAILATERTQRNLSGSVNVVRQQFERILTELEVNQLDTTDARERIGQGILEPLAQLVRRDLVAAADTLGQWGATGSEDTSGRIDPQQVEILAQLRAVLAKMVYREGYQEVVNMLRDIIRLQQDLNAESKKALEEQAHELFDK